MTVETSRRAHQRQRLISDGNKISHRLAQGMDIASILNELGIDRSRYYRSLAAIRRDPLCDDPLCQ